MVIEYLILALCMAYGVGSIPVGYLLGRFHGIDDVRRYGSGVIGATNVGRILGFKYFLIILLLDALKAYAFLMLCLWQNMPPLAVLACAVALLIGNSYSIFLGGIGGKGVATMAGIMLALNPLLCSVSCMTWLIIFALLRTVGMASVMTALLVPVYAFLCTDIYGFLSLIIMAGWVIWRHRSNIYLYYLVR